MTTSTERHIRRLAFTKVKIDQNDPDVAEWTAIRATEIREAHADGVSAGAISAASGLSDETVRKLIGGADGTG